MSKYMPLGEYLQKQDQAEVTLSFDNVEKILNFPLPRTAATHRPYWSNSCTNDGHPGRVWLAAGWRQVRFNVAARSITLRRQDTHESYLRGLALRAIIVDGNQRNEVEIGERSSSVSLRHLDTVEWYVHAYNSVTGTYLLVRGVEPKMSGGGTETGSENDPDATYDEVQQRAIKTRRGQARFRQQLLGYLQASVCGDRIARRGLAGGRAHRAALARDRLFDP